MPMDFSDLKKVCKNAARVHQFREINNGETEGDYRNSLADHVSGRDFIGSEEIK